MAILASRRVGTLLRVDWYPPGKGKSDAPSRCSQRRRRGRPGVLGSPLVARPVSPSSVRGRDSGRRECCAIGASRMDARWQCVVDGRMTCAQQPSIRQWRSPWEGKARPVWRGSRPGGADRPSPETRSHLELTKSVTSYTLSTFYPPFRTLSDHCFRKFKV